MAGPDGAEVAKRLRLVQEPETESEQENDIYTEWRHLLAKTRYEVDDKGNLCCVVTDKNDRPTKKQLANFLARPIREITRDNGIETVMKFEIDGILAGGKPLPPVQISADKFSSLAWVPAEWGLGANVEPGSTNKDKVRHAIQCLAQGVKKETIYAHLGWRKINNKWVYLHAGGVIGADDITIDISEAGLNKYELPEEIEDVTDAAWFSFSTLSVAPFEVTIPLFALTYLAPLCEPLRQAGIEPAFVIWLSGLTGAMKSTLAAIFLSHFGTFTGKSLPGSFKDTANALEKKACLVKDSLFVIDDYHPTASQAEARQMEQKAQMILRGYGDRVARARMRPDTSLKPLYIPRGLCIVTGEDTPQAGQSTTARYLAVEVKKGDIKKSFLNGLQKEPEKLAEAMRGYIDWLIPQMDKLPEQLKEMFFELREKSLVDGQHARIPEVVVWLYMGLSFGLDYLKHTEVIDENKHSELLKEGWEIILQLAERQSQSITEDRPVEKFISTLEELIATKTICLKDLDNDPEEYEPEDFAGWFNVNYYYLLPDTIYKEVVQFCNGQGTRFPVTARTLWKQLEAEGLIYTERDKKQTYRVVQKRIQGKKLRLIILKRTAQNK